MLIAFQKLLEKKKLKELGSEKEKRERKKIDGLIAYSSLR
jgi:flagellar biosynthesis chaperone FliJ